MTGDNEHVDVKNSLTHSTSATRPSPSKKKVPPKKEFVCSQCEKVFNHKGNWRQHIRSHSKERPFSCNLCGKAYTKSSHLLEHKRTHKDINSKDRNQDILQYSCSICDRTFFSSNSFNIHMRSHSEVGTIPCEKCDKKFRHKSSLIRHLKVHAGIKKYGCDLCEKKFFDTSDLKKHMKVHLRYTKTRKNRGPGRKQLNSGSALKSPANNDSDLNHLTEQLVSLEKFPDIGNITDRCKGVGNDAMDDSNLENDGQLLNRNKNLKRATQTESDTHFNTKQESVMRISSKVKASNNLNVISIPESPAENLQDDQPTIGIEIDEIALYDSQMTLMQREKKDSDHHITKKGNECNENFKEISDTNGELYNVSETFVDDSKHGETLEISDEVEQIKDNINEIQKGIGSRNTAGPVFINLLKSEIEHDVFAEKSVLVKPENKCNDTIPNVGNAKNDKEMSKGLIKLNCLSRGSSVEASEVLKNSCRRNCLEGVDNSSYKLNDTETSEIDIESECHLESKDALTVASDLSNDSRENVNNDSIIKTSEDTTDESSVSKISRESREERPNESENMTNTYWRVNRDRTVEQLNERMNEICHQPKKTASNEQYYVSKYFITEPGIIIKKNVGTHEEALRRDLEYLGTRLNIQPSKQAVSESAVKLEETNMFRIESVKSQSDFEINNVTADISKVTKKRTDINYVTENGIEINNETGHTTDMTRTTTDVNNMIENTVANSITENTPHTNHMTENKTDITCVAGNSCNTNDELGKERETYNNTDNTIYAAKNIAACSFDTPVESLLQINDPSVKMQKKDLKIHICRHCNKQFDDHREYIKHLRQHFRKKVFTCECCKQSFQNGRNYSRHECIGFQRKSNYTCVHCDKSFDDEKHLNSHLEKQRISCLICSKVACNVKQFNEHSMTHFDIECLLCSKMFGKINSLNAHVRRAHHDMLNKNGLNKVDCMQRRCNSNKLNIFDEVTDGHLDNLKVNINDIESIMHQTRAATETSLPEKQSDSEEQSTQSRTDDIDISHKEDSLVSHIKPFHQSKIEKLSDTVNQSSSVMEVWQMSSDLTEKFSAKKQEDTEIVKQSAEYNADKDPSKERKLVSQYDVDTIENVVTGTSEMTSGIHMKDRSVMDKKNIFFSKSLERKLNPSKLYVSNSLFCKKNKISKFVYQKEIHSIKRNKVMVNNNKKNVTMKDRDSRKDFSFKHSPLLQRRGIKSTGNIKRVKFTKNQMKNKIEEIPRSNTKVTDRLTSNNESTDIDIVLDTDDKDFDDVQNNDASNAISDNFSDDYMSPSGEFIEKGDVVFDTKSDENTSTSISGEDMETNDVVFDTETDDNTGEDMEEDDVSDNDSDGYEECSVEEIQAMLSGYSGH